MVVFAMAISRRAAMAIPARVRVPSYAVWEVAVFVLNVLAFILVGFQLRQIVQRATWTQYLGVAAAVCVAVIVARIVWGVGRRVRRRLVRPARHRHPRRRTRLPVNFPFRDLKELDLL